MAQFFPSLEQIKRFKVQPTEGEEQLLKFLSQSLDNSYEVYFQPFLNGDRPDIVIMRKDYGVLIIEVKDWNLNYYYTDESNKWRLQKNNAAVKSPVEQVKAYKDNLYNLHIDGLLELTQRKSNYYAMIGCAIYFHCHNEQDALERCSLRASEANHISIIGNDSLNPLNFGKVLEKCHLREESWYFSKELYDCFKALLSPTMHIREDGKEIGYNPKQKVLIRSRAGEQKIIGVAGSGKTRVLAKRAVEAHKRTQDRVLILTYNITLRNYIHDRISEVREDFQWDAFYIMHYHQFFKVEANNHNLKTHEQSYDNFNFFADVQQETTKYNSVFIDEVQDYKKLGFRSSKNTF